MIPEDLGAHFCYRDQDKELFTHRHIAYHLYDLFDARDPFDETRKKIEKILNDQENKRLLYLSLANYYEHYYGTFWNNERAIRMLCEYYPLGIAFDEAEQEKIAAGLFDHISTAGTQRDRGFAFNGISLIEQWIKRLPVPVILLLLKQYHYYHIDNGVHRHQIHAIIMGSEMDDREKEKYKFIYLDSIMLMKCMEPLLGRKWEGVGLNYPSESRQAGFGDPRRVFAERGGNEYACWVYEEERSGIRRVLYVKQEVFLTISLKQPAEDYIQIVCGPYDGKRRRSDRFVFDLDDWLLNQYERIETIGRLEQLLGIGMAGGEFLFSHVYLNGYRDLCRQQLSFDHRCDYDPETKRLRMDVDSSPDFSGFYGSQVHSLTCIVGKNGTGKTGILDFLRASFFRLLAEIDTSDDYADQVFEIRERHSPGLNRNMEFLVVFHLGEKSYFFTNMKDLDYDKGQISPFPRNLFLGSQEHSKIIYFSSKIDGNEVIRQRGTQGVSDEDGKRYEASEGFGNVDFSSAASYLSRMTSEGGAFYVNQELCYQLAFLDAHSDKRLQRLLGWDIKKRDLVLISDEMEGQKSLDQLVRGNLSEWLRGRTDEEIRKMLRNPAARIGHFSSGQFSKLDFLSKLYWCLSGYEHYHEAFEAVVGKNSFHITDSLQPGETAIIFIDEGELYYHPEWQRRYLETLLDMIQRYGREAVVQIVITTNSPFIISDMLEWDVTYLPAGEGRTSGPTFGQNIHTLLTSNFYMNSTIGEVSRKCMEGLLWLLRDPEQRRIQAPEAVTGWINYFLGRTGAPGRQDIPEQRLDQRQARQFLVNFISQIGEEIYREELLEMLDVCWEPDDRELQLDNLRREQERLARQIEKMEQELRGRSK